ncbi:MAG: hypothetical protein KAG96_06045 [Ichthyobacteriaceae bacterium]|nr:hypothetical protein [Ichthyobacteriaceae bacterium]
MIKKIFKNTRASTVMFLFLMFFIVLGYQLYNVELGSNTILNLYNTANYITIIGTVFVSAIMLILYNYTVHSFSVVGKNSFSLLVLVILLSTKNTAILSNVFLSGMFILIAMARLLSMKSNIDLLPKLFDSGLLISIASIFYPPATLYLILVYFSIIIYGVGGWRAWLMPLLGVSSTYVLLFTYYYLNDNLDGFSSHYIMHYVNFGVSEFYADSYTITFLVVLSALTLYSVVNYVAQLGSENIDVRKSFGVVIISYIISILTIIIGDSGTGQELIFAFIPVSIILSKSIEYVKKNMIVNVFLFTLVLLVVVFNFVR